MEQTITITFAGNGFIVRLPYNSDYNLQLQKKTIDYALEATGQKDKLLSSQEDDKRDETLLVFDSFEKVLAFLAGKYSK